MEHRVVICGIEWSDRFSVGTNVSCSWIVIVLDFLAQGDLI